MSVFSRLDEILKLPGMTFNARHNKWDCACYLDGEPHPQKDKTRISEKDGFITIWEQGGDHMPLFDYLVHYCHKSKKEAYAICTEGGTAEPEKFDRPVIKKRYVEQFPDCFPAQYSGNFYKFLCTKFEKQKVNEAFELYQVGENGDLYTIFWHIDYFGNICHDVCIPFMADGHRSKQNSNYRKFRSSEGFVNRCLFGDHIRKNASPIVVESQKTAIIMHLLFPQYRWLASGGNTMLNKELARDYILLPDYDFSILRWKEFGTCPNVSITLFDFLKRNEKIQTRKMKEKYPWFGSDIADYYLGEKNSYKWDLKI